ncbi:MAG: hypothetical protein ACUVSQ_07480 [Pseudanabaenaceae cyanobacterium]
MTLWVCLLVAGVAYAPVLPTFFLADDFGFVDRLVDLPWRDLGSELHRFGGAAFWRPLTVLSFYLDGRLWGVHPMGYHLTSVILHGLAGYVLARWLRLVLALPPAAALAAAGLWLVWPCHGEAVTWIAARSDVLVTLCLVAAWFWLETDRPRWAGVGFGLGLLAKESAWLFPVAVVVRRGWRASLPFWGIWVLYWPLRYLALGQWIGGYGTGVEVTKALTNLAIALIRPVFPWGVPLAVGAVGLAVLTLRAPRWVLLSLLFLLPVAPLGLNGQEGERFLHLPSVFLAGAIAQTVGPHPRRFWLLAAVYGSLLWANHGRWLTASAIAQQLIQDVAAVSPPVTVLTVPDTIDGVYVFRNSFRRAIARFAPPHGRLPEQALQTHLPDRFGGAALLPVAGGWQWLGTPPTQVVWRAPTIPIWDAQGDRFRFAGDRTLYYDQGRLVPVPK